MLKQIYTNVKVLHIWGGASWLCFHMYTFCNIWISFDMPLSWFAFIYGGNVHSSSFCFLSGLSPSLQEPCHSFCNCDLMVPICLFPFLHLQAFNLCIPSTLSHFWASRKKIWYIVFKEKRKKTSLVFRVSKMAHWIKIPGELSSISGTHIRSGRRKPDSTKDILWPPHVYHVIWGHVHNSK